MLNKVMVIDDSDADLLYTSIILERSGSAEQVLPFGSAADALAFLDTPEGATVDVILLDINMPEMNGFAFLEAYERACSSRERHPVVVMLTSSPDPTDRARALSFSSVRSYVVKPIDKLSAQGLAAVVEQARQRSA